MNPNKCDATSSRGFVRALMWTSLAHARASHNKTVCATSYHRGISRYYSNIKYSLFAREQLAECDGGRSLFEFNRRAKCPY